MHPRTCTMKTKYIRPYLNQEKEKKISDEVTDRKGDIKREYRYTKNH